MFMMGIIKNCCFISYKSLDHLQSEIPTSGTSCIKDSDFWLTLLCSE